MFLAVVFQAETSTVIFRHWNSCHGNNCHHLWCLERKMRHEKRPHIVWQTVSLQFPSIKSPCHMACSSCEGSDRTFLLKMEGLKELTAGRNISEAIADGKRERGGEGQTVWLTVSSICLSRPSGCVMCRTKKPLIPYLKSLSARQMCQAHEN